MLGLHRVLSMPEYFLGMSFTLGTAKSSLNYHEKLKIAMQLLIANMRPAVSSPY